MSSMLANVSLGQEGGPKSKRKASFLKPATGPCGSVKAMLCKVTGSNSLSALGGKSNNESLAASTKIHWVFQNLLLGIFIVMRRDSIISAVSLYYRLINVRFGKLTFWVIWFD